METDPLTGALPKDRWAATLDDATWVALVDVDHMKRFNAHNGHDKGDELLRTVGAILVANDRAKVVRMRGDAFAIVWTCADPPADVCERLVAWARRSLTPEQPAHCGDAHCLGPARLSFTVALGRRREGETPASLYRRLDVALIAAKIAGRDRVMTID